MKIHKLHAQPHRQTPTLLGHTLRRQRPRTAPSVAPADLVEMQRQAEIDQELQLARDIQQGLLLEAVPRVPGWEISAVSLPARDLGGDLYDFLPIRPHQHGIMIGDVSGKGLPAALRMAVARTVFRHAARPGSPPGIALAGTNQGVISEVPQGMVTMLYTILDARTGWMQFANAGHNYPLLVNGDVTEIELSGMPLGVDDESEYQECGTLLKYGDIVVFYTDGVVEATNAAEEMYGYDRLADLMRQHARSKPRALVATLLQDLRAWSSTAQSDDITVVILRRRFNSVAAELHSVADDVLGRERAAALWDAVAMPSDDAPLDAWVAAAKDMVRVVQTQFGRGLARELHGQVHLALEEYRELQHDA